MKIDICQRCGEELEWPDQALCPACQRILLERWQSQLCIECKRPLTTTLYWMCEDCVEKRHTD